LLSTTSIADLPIEKLAKSLKVAKSGFYWHFRDRDELLVEMLRYWTTELTEVVTRNEELMALEPRQRLTVTAEMILVHNLTRYELAVRQWALEDKRAAKSVRKVDQARLDFVKATLAELGLSGDDLDMRSLLFVCYHTWEGPMFPEIPVQRRRELISKLIDLLTGA
jgi:AcrR family transcriptional regulator